MKVLKEVTKWEVDYRQPNHTYLMNGDKIVAYRAWHEGKPQAAHGHRLDQRYRKFVEVPLVAEDWNGFADVDTDPAVIRIQGSGNKTYEINVDKETCSCPGFTFRGACKHIQQYKKERVNA